MVTPQSASPFLRAELPGEPPGAKKEELLMAIVSN